MFGMMASIHIETYRQIIASRPPQDVREIDCGLDAIFFASSNTTSFASDEARALFRERWLGRYLTYDPQWTYVAMTSGGDVAGYLAGCLEDPARTPRFADIGYFGAFAGLTARYPAHLHINLAQGFRSGGIGSALIARFGAEARHAGAPGVHVVTSRGARNVRFYERNGFHEAGAMGAGLQEVVFLAKNLITGAQP